MLRQHRLTLQQRAPRLHQVVHNHDVAARGLALFQAHDTLGAVSNLRSRGEHLRIRDGGPTDRPLSQRGGDGGLTLKRTMRLVPS